MNVLGYRKRVANSQLPNPLRAKKLCVEEKYCLPTDAPGGPGETILSTAGTDTVWGAPSGGGASTHCNFGFTGNALITVIAAQNTWTPVNGVFTTSVISADFSFVTDTLTYTGATGGDFLCIWTWCFILDTGNADIFEYSIFKNGVVWQPSVQCARNDDTSQYPRPCSTSAIIPLATGDTIRLYCRNTTDNENMIFINSSMNIISL